MKFSDIFVKDLFMKPVDHSEGGFVLVDQSGIMFKEYYSVCGGRYLFPKRAVKRIEYLRHLGPVFHIITAAHNTPEYTGTLAEYIRQIVFIEHMADKP